ncbi:MAG: lysophospholipid acyltransferase family protein [Candidatus Aminicenantaceae bacterium]
MSILSEMRWIMTGIAGRILLWIWTQTCRLKVKGEKEYLDLRKAGKPVILLVWHSKIFIVPYFFRKKNIMPLISPSEDGEIPARIMSGWGYKILRGSGSHTVVKAWNTMKRELKRGGQVIIVPDGPKGPNRKFKAGGIKLAQQTGAYMVPFTFWASRVKILNSWDRFVIFKPFSKIIALYGKPIKVNSRIEGKKLEEECQRMEDIMNQLDEEARE